MSKKAPTANTTSTNWSGYAVETNLANPQANAFTDVQAKWIVPTVSPSADGKNAYSSTWIGLDGNSSKTVEQIGTEQDIIKGEAVYYAWYEMYPKSPVKIDLVIEPGDEIFANVEYLGNNTFQLSLDNLSDDKQPFSIEVESSKPIRSSAEWIVEGTGRVADFDTVMFTDALATANNVEGSISNPAWQAVEITMVTSKSGSVIADPTDLSANGKSFSIDYVANSTKVATLAASNGAHADLTVGAQGGNNGGAGNHLHFGGPNDDKFVFGLGSGNDHVPTSLHSDLNVVNSLPPQALQGLDNAADHVPTSLPAGETIDLASTTGLPHIDHWLLS